MWPADSSACTTCLGEEGELKEGWQWDPWHEEWQRRHREQHAAMSTHIHSLPRSAAHTSLCLCWRACKCFCLDVTHPVCRGGGEFTGHPGALIHEHLLHCRRGVEVPVPLKKKASLSERLPKVAKGLKVQVARKVLGCARWITALRIGVNGSHVGMDGLSQLRHAAGLILGQPSQLLRRGHEK